MSNAGVRHQRRARALRQAIYACPTCCSYTGLAEGKPTPERCPIHGFRWHGLPVPRMPYQKIDWSKARPVTEWRFFRMASKLDAGDLILPASVRGHYGFTNTDELLAALTSHGVVDPVYRVERGEWVEDLVRLSGTPPEQIEVAFRRTRLPVTAVTLGRQIPPEPRFIWHGAKLHGLVKALLRGDLLAARQWVADARTVQWESVQRPNAATQRELVIAAAMVELLAARAGAEPPAWTDAVGALPEPLVLDPGLEALPRSFAEAQSHGPEPLRKRNLVAPPDFLDVR